jgi:hypothetical protein
MTPEQFVYWLHGYFELTEPIDNSGQFSLTPEQVTIIKQHLDKVFNREYKDTIQVNDPIYGIVGYRGVPHSC